MKQIALESKNPKEVELEKKNRIIELFKNLYVQLNEVIVSDWQSNCHRKTLKGEWSGGTATAIRIRNHYPHFPGYLWGSYNMKDALVNRYLTGTVAYRGMPFRVHTCPVANSSNVTGGNCYYTDSGGTKIYNQSVVKEDVFYCIPNGYTTVNEETVYPSMLYSFKAPYIPTEGTADYYVDTTPTYPYATSPTAWQYATLDTEKETWEIDIEMARYWNVGSVGSYDVIGQPNNQYKYDARLQLIEVQLVGEDNKLASRLYYIWHLPQAFLSSYKAIYYSKNTSGGTDTVEIGFGESGYKWNNITFCIGKKNAKNIIPLPFPITSVNEINFLDSVIVTNDYDRTTYDKTSSDSSKYNISSIVTYDKSKMEIVDKYYLKSDEFNTNGVTKEFWISLNLENTKSNYICGTHINDYWCLDTSWWYSLLLSKFTFSWTENHNNPPYFTGGGGEGTLSNRTINFNRVCPPNCYGCGKATYATLSSCNDGGKTKIFSKSISTVGYLNETAYSDTKKSYNNFFDMYCLPINNVRENGHLNTRCYYISYANPNSYPNQPEPYTVFPAISDGVYNRMNTFLVIRGFINGSEQQIGIQETCLTAVSGALLWEYPSS